LFVRSKIPAPERGAVGKILGTLTHFLNVDFKPLIMISEAPEPVRIFAEAPEKGLVMATEAPEGAYNSTVDQIFKVAIPSRELVAHPAGVKGFSSRWVLFSWLVDGKRLAGKPSRSSLKQEARQTPERSLEPGFLAAVCQQLSYVNLFGDRSPSHGCFESDSSLFLALPNRTNRELWSCIAADRVAAFLCPVFPIHSF
tara:strand:+ start:5886 stop:6479 length:594 start_codon:yes stop_codon:yes gene_type:complete